MATSTGIDVSKWQGQMDWNQAYNAGARFAFIRAGSIDNISGQCYEDYQFRRNAEIAPDYMPCGFYWYMRPNHDPVKQADYFTNLLAKHAPKQKLDAVCDIEVPGKADKVREFCEQSVSMIYSNLNTVKYLLTGDKEWMAQYRLWLADWDAFGNVIPPWEEWIVWQTGPKQNGFLYGAQSNAIDHNIATEKLIETPPPPPPPEPCDTIVFKMTYDGTWNVRAGPGTNYADVGDLHEGDIVEVEADMYGANAWAKIVSGQYAGKYFAVSWANSAGVVVRSAEPV